MCVAESSSSSPFIIVLRSLRQGSRCIDTFWIIKFTAFRNGKIILMCAADDGDSRLSACGLMNVPADLHCADMRCANGRARNVISAG